MKFKGNPETQKSSLMLKWQQNRQLLISILLILILLLCQTSYAKTEKINFYSGKKEVSEMFPQSLAQALPAIKGNKTITLDWLLTNQSVDYDPATISWFDNKNIIYSVPSLDGNQDRLFEMINIDTHEKRTLGKGATPVVSPDKQRIAFVRGKNEARQLWIMDKFGGNIKQISHVADGLFPSNYFTKYIWSPDSKNIVLLYKQNYNDTAPDQITPPSKVELIDIVTSQTSSLGTFDNRVRDLSWIPKSNEILFTQERFGFDHKDNVDYELISTLNIENKKIRMLAKFNGWQQQLSPQSSPDGKLIAFSYDPDSPLFDVTQSIGLIKNDGESNNGSPEIVRLTHDIKFHLPAWSANGDRIYVLRSYGAYKQIYSVEISTGKINQITSGAKSVQSFSISPDGSQVAWIDLNAHGAQAIRVALNNGDKIKNIFTISNIPEKFSLSEVREIQWSSPDYPVPMRGLLLMPQNYKKGKRYPLIVDIHGGGRSATLGLNGGGLLTTTPLEWQVWTAKDYAVFVPEFRSSGAFGSLAMTRDHYKNHDLLFGDLRDIDAGVDYLIDQGIVDGSRLAVVGHSAGARRANLLTTISHRYRAIVSHDGWADDYISAINNPTYTLFYPEMGGSPWEVPDNYLKDSALTHANGATTPTLFLMGNPKLGGADSDGTVSNLFDLLKQQNVETQYIYYPDEGHVFTKLENRKDSFERAINWIHNILNKNNSSTAPKVPH
jgi:dipeptidyl aminopeptidase/acylaminoacyl peptidase